MNAAQSRAARGLLQLSQGDLAKAAGVGLSTVVDFELSRRAVSEKAVVAIRTALEAAGVEFIPPNGSGAGVRLKKAPNGG
jgi:transcriptional regulator with XRE-family HTH domain